MGTKEELSIEELGAEVSTSVLTPLRFLERSAACGEDRPAVVDGKQTWTYAEHDERVRRAAAAVRDELEIGEGDRVAVLLPNVALDARAALRRPRRRRRAGPAQHAPRRDPEYDYILEHCGAKVLVADRELQKALDPRSRSSATAPARGLGRRVRRSSVEAADADPSELERPEDERTLISINYTSGTTGKPKGVMTNHRGAYLHALGVIAEARLTPRSSLPVDAPDVPLQRLGLSVGRHGDGRQARLPPQGGGEADLERAHQGGHHAPLRRADRADHDRRRRRGREARRARPGVRRAARRRRPRCWARAPSSTSRSPTCTG